jgi:hypothetical protein
METRTGLFVRLRKRIFSIVIPSEPSGCGFYWSPQGKKGPAFFFFPCFMSISICPDIADYCGRTNSRQLRAP